MLFAVTFDAPAAIAAGALTNASVALSDPRPGVTSNYTVTGSSVDGVAAVFCVKVVWSTTASGDTAPTGFDGSSGNVDAANSTLINSSSTNWSLARSDGTASSGQKNIYQYTNSASGVVPSTTSGATFVLDGITNPATADAAYYLKINTYGNTNCSSSPINNATVAFINTNGSLLSVSVDDSLSFSVNAVASGQSCGGGTTGQGSTASTIPFGSVSTAANVIVCQDLTAATNATGGYTIYVRYTSAVSDGTHSFADLSPGTNASPSAFSAHGTEAYGYTTDDQTLSTCSGSCNANRFYNGSSFSWAALTTSNAEVAYEPAGDNSTTYRIGHQAGVSSGTPAGTYTTTVLYTCTPVY
jgi:hypothetical protein